ncbi:MAG: hypothetical protein II740_06445, partial [Lachnospiraceae bacterium]|nr:hypothetical protein [Lachnospiraceae bacterium]
MDFAVNQHYYHSLAAFIYLFFSLFKYSSASIAFVLAIATSITVFFTFKLLKAFNEHFKVEVNDNVLYVVSFFANFNMGFYIKAANKQHYIGYENANMWHNSMAHPRSPPDRKTSRSGPYILPLAGTSGPLFFEKRHWRRRLSARSDR